jgi:hypothetical protein
MKAFSKRNSTTRRVNMFRSGRSHMLIACLIGAVCALSVLAVPTAGQSQIGIQVVSSQPSNFAGPAGQAATNFTMRPSVTSSTLNAGVQTLPLTVHCFNVVTGAIINNCNVTITHKARAFSGGHDHDSASRPKGTFQPVSGSTGTSGLNTTYTSPEPSGIIDITITGTAPDGTALIPSTFTIGVQIDGLTSLGAGTNYILVGATANHGDNHYGTASLNGALVTLADSYAAAFPNNKLAYNDMSLVTGGVFDISGGWAPPHASHRMGVDCDVRFVPAAQRRRLRQLITAAGISTVFVEGDHWHMRQ